MRKLLLGLWITGCVVYGLVHAFGPDVPEDTFHVEVDGDRIEREVRESVAESRAEAREARARAREARARAREARARGHDDGAASGPVIESVAEDGTAESVRFEDGVLEVKEARADGTAEVVRISLKDGRVEVTETPALPPDPE